MNAPLMSTYAPPDIMFERGEGSYLIASNGARYLDFIAGIAVNALGHAHPVVVEALKAQAEKLWHLSNMYQTPGQRELAAAYCAATFADRVFFTNSGAEAVECAIKTARRHHFVNGRPERVNIIGFEGSFHGRTLAAVNASGNPKYLEGFGPTLPGFVQLPFGDHDALRRTVNEATAAVIIEPVQGEGGVRAVPDACLKGVRDICDERGALVIYDEVQCGAGRTGKLYAHQWIEGAEPDIMAIAKGIGAGFPMGACLAKEAVADGMTLGVHGSTFGGNALAMAVGRAVFGEMTKPGFLDHVIARANQLRQGLAGLMDAYPDLIEEIRGKGLLVGFKLKCENTALRNAARQRGLLVGLASDNVVRLAPPLNVAAEDVSKAVAILDEALAAARVPA